MMDHILLETHAERERDREKQLKIFQKDWQMPKYMLKKLREHKQGDNKVHQFKIDEEPRQKCWRHSSEKNVLHTDDQE